MTSTLHEAVERALAAEAALERAERDRDEWKEQHRRDAFKAQAAEARAQKAEAERDELKQSIKTVIKEDGVVVSRQAAQLAKAEAERELWKQRCVDAENDVEFWHGKAQKAEAVVEAARAYCAVHLDERPVKSLNEVVALRSALAALDEQEQT